MKISFIGETKKWTHYIFNYPINYKKSANFKLRVIKTENKDIMIGVVDYAKQKDQKSSYNSGNAMCYYGFNG